MDIDLPDVVAEVRDVFDRYETALVTNDVAGLDAFFWDSPSTVRYGTGENLLGIAAIRHFRATRSSVGLQRTLRHTVVTTYGRDCATAMTEFLRPAFTDGGQLTKVGRQSQTWVRFPVGWRVVAAHVSVLPLTEPEPLPPLAANPSPHQPGG